MHELFTWGVSLILYGFGLGVLQVPNSKRVVAAKSFFLMGALWGAGVTIMWAVSTPRHFLFRLLFELFCFGLIGAGTVELFRFANHTQPLEPTSSTSQTDSTRERPDVSLRIVNPKSIALTVENNSSVLARNVRYSLSAWNLDSERPGSLPILSREEDWVRPNEYTFPEAFAGSAKIAPLVKSGNRLLGIASVTCSDCVKTKTYWLYAVHGQGGWFAESPEGTYADASATDKLIPKIRANPDSFFRDIPESARIRIEEHGHPVNHSSRGLTESQVIFELVRNTLPELPRKLHDNVLGTVQVSSKKLKQNERKQMVALAHFKYQTPIGPSPKIEVRANITIFDDRSLRMHEYAAVWLGSHLRSRRLSSGDQADLIIGLIGNKRIEAYEYNFSKLPESDEKCLNPKCTPLRGERFFIKACFSGRTDADLVFEKSQWFSLEPKGRNTRFVGLLKPPAHLL